MGTVAHLPASNTMTVDQALASASHVGFQDVIVIGYDEEGQFCSRSSHMDRKDALWLAHQLLKHALGD
jgi:hypothetical protein